MRRPRTDGRTLDEDSAMHAIRSSRYTFAALLICIGTDAGAAATADHTAPNASIPYEFCVSEPATNSKVYVSPTFQDPLRDVHDAFAGYLGNSRGYRGNARCYTLPSRELADEFRDEEIQILHWQGLDHVVATQWQPVPDSLTSAQSRGDEIR
jgi:hypothetical protein